MFWDRCYWFWSHRLWRRRPGEEVQRVLDPTLFKASDCAEYNWACSRCGKKWLLHTQAEQEKERAEILLTGEVEEEEGTLSLFDPTETVQLELPARCDESNSTRTTEEPRPLHPTPEELKVTS